MTDTRTLIIADDFTGAMDTGVKFLSSGGVRVVLDVALATSEDVELLWEDASTLVIDTETRNLDPIPARERLGLACQIASVGSGTSLFKKVDSTLRGNVGVEIDEIMNSTGIEVTCFAPASPEQGRTVKGGISFIRGVPLLETESGSDPVRPVISSIVSEIIADGSQRSAALLLLSTVREGVDAVAEVVQAATAGGAEIVIADAETDEDLQTVANAFASLERKVLLAGSAGLAKAVARIRMANDLARADAGDVPVGDAPVRDSPVGDSRGVTERGDRSRVPPFANQVLAVLGSVMQTTTQQLASLRRWFPAAPTVFFSGPAIAADPDGEMATLLQRCLAQFEPGEPWILATDPSNVISSAGSQMAGRTIAGAIAKVVVGVVERRGVDGLVLTGGSTAYAVAKEMNIGSISVLAEIEAGIVHGTCRSASLHRDVRIVTKGGGFGGPDDLASAVEFLQDRGVG